MTCARVQLRMACPECGYPYSEAMYPTLEGVPHTQHDVSEEELRAYRLRLGACCGLERAL